MHFLLVYQKRTLSIKVHNNNEPFLIDRAWEEEIVQSNKSTKKKRQPSLIYATWSTYRYRYGMIGIQFFIYVRKNVPNANEVRGRLRVHFSIAV